jgi:putative redox protein
MVEAAVAPGEVLAERANGKFATLIRTSEHSLLVDEPVAVGGLDGGPGPYDLLLGALGACTSMTIRLYAAREHIPLEDVTVRLRHERDHAQDCASCDQSPARIEAIFRTIALVGPLSDEQRARLMELAEKCPVHRTLTGQLHIHSELADQ